MARASQQMSLGSVKYFIEELEVHGSIYPGAWPRKQAAFLLWTLISLIFRSYQHSVVFTFPFAKKTYCFLERKMKLWVRLHPPLCQICSSEGVQTTFPFSVWNWKNQIHSFLGEPTLSVTFWELLLKTPEAITEKSLAPWSLLGKTQHRSWTNAEKRESCLNICKNKTVGIQ